MWKSWGTPLVPKESDFLTTNAAPAKTRTRHDAIQGMLPRKGDGWIDERLTQTPFSNFMPAMFPTTRYYGSKRRQLEWLCSEFGNIKGKTALDAFGGTGAVTFLLQNLGWNTTYNDIFDFNTVTARALFSQPKRHLVKNDLERFLNAVTPIDGFITKNFEGLYFTSEENRWLDGYMACIANEPRQMQDVLLYCLFQACLKKRPFNLFHRANLHLRHSEMPVKFGNRSTWNTSFEAHIMSTFEEVQTLHHKLRGILTVTAGSCVSQISPQYDLLYLDPPYFKKAKKNTETYIERYHFLEGLARYNEWHTLIDHSSSIKSFKRPYRTEWASKSDMLSSIDALIMKHSNAAFALSYVAGEEPSEEELFNLFKNHFDRVRLSKRSFGRVLSTKETYEILLIGQ